MVRVNWMNAEGRRGRGGEGSGTAAGGLVSGEPRASLRGRGWPRPGNAAS